LAILFRPILSVPDDGFSRNASWGLNLISTLYYYHFVGGLLFPEGIIHPVGSASAALSDIGDLSGLWLFILGQLD